MKLFAPDEVARTIDERDADRAAVRALVDALPKCDAGQMAWGRDALPYAAPLRALFKRMESWDDR